MAESGKAIRIVDDVGLRAIRRVEWSCALRCCCYLLLHVVALDGRQDSRSGLA